MRVSLLNYGGGHQTIAMLVLIAHGVLPVPDHIVIADTGREAQSTWDYLDEIARPFCERHGLPPIQIAPRKLAKVDLYGHNGDLLLPAFTQAGMLKKYCSVEWKVRVVDRYMSQEHGYTASRREHWIGYAWDERSRWNRKRKTAEQLKFPLVEHMVKRGDCEIIIKRAGLPVPYKSACFMCPYRSNDEWKAVRDYAPEQWKEAIELDRAIRDDDEGGGVWLHHSRKPLEHADLDEPDRKSGQHQCGLGVCFV